MKSFVSLLFRDTFLKFLILLFLFDFISCQENEDKKLQDNSIDSTKQHTKELQKNKSKLYSENLDTLLMELNSILPSNYSALDITRGDLNLDEYPDVIVVLKKKDEENTSDPVDHPEKRPLLIYTGQPGKTYKLEAKNDNAVLCVDCGGTLGDPFRKILIKNGYFSIENSGGSSWSWARIITFKYSKPDNNWYLHKDGKESFHRSDPEKVESKIYTNKDFGKVPFDKFDVYLEN